MVAATSRPDLVDAALLRPGRLDRLLYCGFPGAAARGQVLGALARRLRLHPAIDLPALAAQAAHYTGADLGALLAEAQLAAVHEAIAEGGGEEEGPEGATAGAAAAAAAAAAAEHGPLITPAHLRTALAGSRPSIGPEERGRLEGLYRRFQQSRDPGLGAAGGGEGAKGKMVSWA